MEKNMPKRKRYYYKPGTDGCDETFDVYTPDDQYVVSVRFWEAREWAENEARKIVRLLNKHREEEWVPTERGVVS
jgi:hypothetical protein